MHHYNGGNADGEVGDGDGDGGRDGDGDGERLGRAVDKVLGVN